MIRETYYAALFTLLSGLQTTGVVTVCARKIRLLADMGAAELPALFMVVDHQNIEQRRGFPPKHTLAAKVYLYAANNDRHVTGGIALNTLIDAVETILTPGPLASVQTLSTAQNPGDLVSHAWIEGKVEVFEGVDQRAAAILTINMLVP